MNKPTKIIVIFLLSTLFLLGLKVTEFSFYALLNADGLAGAIRIFSALFHPEFAILPQALRSMFETLLIAWMATLLSLPFAFFLSFPAARNLSRHSIGTQSAYIVLRTLMNVSRSIEPVIWAIVFSVWVGIGPFAGMLALWIHSVVSLIKLYSEQIESVERGPIEAIESTGASRVQVILFGVIPQVVNPFLAYTLYRWDSNIRMATIIGLVGGGGIGTLLVQYQGLARWNEVGTLILIVAFTVWALDGLSARLRARLQ